MEFYLNPHAIILRVSGKDSRRYLNARLSNDIKIIQTGSHTYGAALSPQGKAEGLFAILCISTEDFLLVCDGGHSEKIIQAFRRYIVADRVDVKDISKEYTQLIIYTEQLSPEISANIYSFASSHAAVKSFDLIVPNEKLTGIIDTLSAVKINYEEYRLRGIKAGIPFYPEEINDHIIFSAAGLDYALSFKKGCYVGQEVVEKIDAYGRVPYVLKPASVAGRVEGELNVRVNGKELDADKIFPHYYDSKDDKTYLFLELKNADNILASEISINNNKAQLLC